MVAVAEEVLDFEALDLDAVLPVNVWPASSLRPPADPHGGTTTHPERRR